MCAGGGGGGWGEGGRRLLAGGRVGVGWVGGRKNACNRPPDKIQHMLYTDRVCVH